MPISCIYARVALSRARAARASVVLRESAYARTYMYIIICMHVHTCISVGVPNTRQKHAAL